MSKKIQIERAIQNGDHQEAARLVARGSHQNALVEGWSCLKGRCLAGKAALYTARYVASGKNLLARLDQEGITYRVIRKRIRKGGRSQATCLGHVLEFPQPGIPWLWPGEDPPSA